MTYVRPHSEGNPYCFRKPKPYTEYFLPVFNCTCLWPRRTLACELQPGTLTPVTNIWPARNWNLTVRIVWRSSPPGSHRIHSYPHKSFGKISHLPGVKKIWQRHKRISMTRQHSSPATMILSVMFQRAVTPEVTAVTAFTAGLAAPMKRVNRQNLFFAEPSSVVRTRRIDGIDPTSQKVTSKTGYHLKSAPPPLFRNHFTCRKIHLWTRTQIRKTRWACCWPMAQCPSLTTASLCLSATPP